MRLWSYLLVFLVIINLLLLVCFQSFTSGINRPDGGGTQREARCERSFSTDYTQHKSLCNLLDVFQCYPTNKLTKRGDNNPTKETISGWFERVNNTIHNRMNIIRYNSREAGTIYKYSAPEQCWQEETYDALGVQEIANEYSNGKITCKIQPALIDLPYRESDVSTLLYYKGIFHEDIRKRPLTSYKREGSVRIAYLIMTRVGQSKEVFRLMKLIYDPRHYYILHLDKKLGEPDTEGWASEYEGFLKHNPNVKIMQRRFVGIWGGISIVYIELSGMMQLLTMGPWDFWINLSATDVPVTTNSQLISYLDNYTKQNFVWYRRLPILDQLNYYVEEISSIDIHCASGKHGHTLSSYNKTEEEKLWRTAPREVSWYLGQTWMVINRKTVEYLATNESFINPLLEYSKNIHLPEEKLLQTLIVNRFPDDVINDYKRYVNWSSPTGININSVDVDIFTHSPTTQYLFARKMVWEQQMHEYLEWFLRMKEEHDGIALDLEEVMRGEWKESK